MRKTKQTINVAHMSAGAWISHAARLLNQRLAEAQQPLQLTPGQYKVLVELWKKDGLTQRELVQRLDIEQSTIGNTLNRMERDELIERRPHPTDGRAQLICLASRAIDLKGAAVAAADTINQRALAGFSDQERSQLFMFMERIVLALKEEPAD